MVTIPPTMTNATPADTQFLACHHGDTASEIETGEMAGKVDTNASQHIHAEATVNPATSPKIAPLRQFADSFLMDTFLIPITSAII